MSFFSVETVQVFAESIGISNLKEDVSVALAQEVEYRIREVIQDSAKFMIHSHHSKLSCEDINQALRMKHSDRLYGYDPTEPLNFRLIPNSNIFFTPDPEIDLEAFLSSPLPKAPLAPHFTAHWLAIEGVQPMIPENPQLSQPPASTLQQSTYPIAHPTLPDTKDAGDKAILVTAKKDISLIQEDAEVTPCVKHVLSKEMQLFYDTVIGCITSGKVEERHCAFESLKTDAGLQQLLPYFIQYVSESIARNLRNLTTLMPMLEMSMCLASNPHLFIEPYLHQLMPVILSCVVGKTVGIPLSASTISLDEQLAARRKSAQVVAFIDKKYAAAYQSLLTKSCKPLIKCISDTEMPLSCHYGAFFCLCEMGMETIESVVMPILEEYVKSLGWENRFDTEKVSVEQREEIEAVWKVLISICTRYLAWDEATDNNKEMIERVFGDELYLMDVSGA